MTPIKDYEAKGGRGAQWTDNMKVQLLKLYLEKAMDPLERPPPSQGARSRAVYKKQVPEEGELYQNSALYLEDGSKVNLKSVCKVTTLWEILASKGMYQQTKKNTDWDGGPGLVHIIDKVMEDSPSTREALEDKKEEVMILAKDLAKK